jgi:hypothetical protein
MEGLDFYRPFIGSNLRRNTDQVQEFPMKNHDFEIPKASGNVITHKIIFFVFCLYICSIDSQALWWRKVTFFPQINEECHFLLSAYI